MTTVAFCEIEPYCQAVLKKHWPEVPCYEDIKTMEAFRTAEAPGNGYVRVRDVSWEGRNGILSIPTVDVGCIKTTNKNARQNSCTSTQKPNRKENQATTNATPLPCESQEDHTGAGSGRDGTRQDMPDVWPTRNGHRPCDSGIERRANRPIKLATSVPDLSPSEVGKLSQEGGANGSLCIGPIDVICGGFP